jgi:sigma-54 dependent transcriptional regulator, acetoin dehydrogenase operon transcriptional activator AcoR
VHEGKRILIAEDEGIVARDIESRLTSMGYTPVGWVISGEEAITAAEELHPDLVLMDIRLHGLIDGIDAARELRRRFGLPVVFLTAHADHSTLARVREARPLGYLLKPFQDKDLEISIALALVRHAAEVEIKAREQWLSTTLFSIGDAVIATDETGAVRLMNPVAEGLTGWPAYEAVGRPLTEVVSLVDEQSRLPIADPANWATEQRTGHSPADHLLLISRDGTEVPVDGSAAPITNDLGSTLGVVLVLRNLSEHRAHQHELSGLLSEVKRANSELEDQKGFLSALFESIPSAILVVSPEGKVQSVNSSLETIFGAVAPRFEELLFGETLGCPAAIRAPGTCGTLEGCGACAIRAAVHEALAGNQLHRLRVELTVQEGIESRTLVLLVSAIPSAHRGRDMALLILEDVTEISGLRALLGGAEQGFAGLIGRNPKMIEVFETIREVAGVSSPVLIQGESGTGKELVARAIHNESERATRSFIAVNCGALPEGLLESELFGHVKGAFTGAIRDKRGRFELADGGTILLDEIGDLPTSMQVKLLRVLQERKFERVGGERTISVNVRVLAATNRDLRREIAAGRFREDLYYRLCVVPIVLPPLRERLTDIPLIANHILEKLAALSGHRRSHISPDAMAVLMEHVWPGNVRELQNVLEFALIKSRNRGIEPSHLPEGLRRTAPAPSVRSGRPRKLTADQVAKALEAAGGNRVQAARSLGVGRATLYRFLGEHLDRG